MSRSNIGPEGSFSAASRPTGLMLPDHLDLQWLLRERWCWLPGSRGWAGAAYQAAPSLAAYERKRIRTAAWQIRH